MRFVLILAAAACDSSPPPAQTWCLEVAPPDGLMVAKVGDVPITSTQIHQRIKEQGASQARRYNNPKKMRQFVEDQIRFELLVQAAKERGLDRDPAVVDAARKVMVRKLLQRDLGTTVFEGKVGDAAILAYYERNIDEYRQPEKRRIAEIQLAPTEDGKALAQSLLDKLQRRPQDNNLMRLFAAKHSLHKESKSRGGEHQYASQDELAVEFGQSFAEDVFEVEPGTLVPELVQSTKGWHVLKVIARRDALTRGVDEVRDEIREKLLRGQRSKVFEQYLQDIKQRHPVALYEDKLPELLVARDGAEK